ncbi:serine O-acetyltransferase EpsC [Variovorax sp. LG9.2]|uniref:serine O-acetyltransferase EpsC n=1 Tax=Variovorax sp. LG9.2 TaxID=3048626 RepID=UPI002B23023C|nr:serine O-acetyltransferase EpsC [Variovorax sp. LG9.2]MEB0056528.1 serine O-acetyltransferase [Variovorax sp. LG9.2]
MAGFQVDEIVSGLHQVRRNWRESQKRSQEGGERELPSRDVMAEVVEALTGALFPMRLGPTDLRQESEDFYVAHTLDAALHQLHAQATLELRHTRRHSAAELAELSADAQERVRAFAAELPGIRTLLDTDVMAAFHGDPAARSVDEVLLCYPGVLAMIHYRMAHPLYKLGLTLLARIVAERAHAQTGIDIHPGAQIGAGFFIDHGTGVVIGETAVIGERVRLYQAVTLGAKRFPTDSAGHLKKGLPRHPVLEDEVVIYAGATILGRVTIGKGATIGGNVWVTQDVPPGCSLTQAQSREVTREPNVAPPGLVTS